MTKEERRIYQREWSKKNKDKIKSYQEKLQKKIETNPEFRKNRNEYMKKLMDDRRREAGVPSIKDRRKNWEKILKEYAGGASIKRLMKKHKLSRTAIYQHIRDSKLRG